MSSSLTNPTHFVSCKKALKSVKTSEFMPYVVFIAAPPVDIMRNMHEFARMRGKVETFKSVSGNNNYVVAGLCLFTC